MNCDELVRALRGDPMAGWACSADGDFLRLRSPLRYPDGGVIELYVEQRGRAYVVSDFGEARRFLDGAGIDVSKSALRLRLVEIARQLGNVDETDGVFEVTVNDPAHILAAATRLSQVVSRVGDLMLLGRNAIGGTFADQVADYLREQVRSAEINRHALVPGHSQRWRVDILARTAVRVIAVEALAAVTPGGANAQTAFSVQKFVDISHSGDSPARYCILDDEADVWSQSLRTQLAHVSDVMDWDQRERLVAALRA